jgi:hypothetical protein
MVFLEMLITEDQVVEVLLTQGQVVQVIHHPQIHLKVITEQIQLIQVLIMRQLEVVEEQLLQEVKGFLLVALVVLGHLIL